MTQIGADLHAGVSALQWVLDAYNLVYASFLLTGGTLGDLFGRRAVFALGIGLFTAGSLVCGLAPDGAVLIAGRALSGLGAALALPTSLSLLTVAYPDSSKRVRAIGVWASCYGLAMIIGPILGGFLVETAGWRSIFFVIVPICVLAIALVVSLPESSNARGRRLDLLGQTLGVLALGSLSFAAIEGAHLGWTSPLVFGALVMFGVTLPAFLLRQRRSGGLVPLDLFRNQVFSASLAIASCMTFGMYAMLFLVPLYLQSLRGASALVAGLDLLPLAFTFVVVSQYSGRLMNGLGARRVMTAGMGLMGGGLVLLALVSGQTEFWPVAAALTAVGAGLGLEAGPVMAVAVASVPPERSGTASGLGNTARMIGATLGVAVLGAIFAAHVGGTAATLAGLRFAYLGGALVELTGAALALAFVRRGSHHPGG
jgi:EmrB/QacA subfamily drug resistance transporter